MILCTDCYIQKDGKTLMLYRNKKENDINEGKYIGVGGKFEGNESPEECVIREVMEEAGVTLKSFKMRGTLTFDIKEPNHEPLLIFLFTATEYEGEITKDCPEGQLRWVDTEKITELNIWEGDKLFWKWLQDDTGFFSAKFEYKGDTLMDYQVRFY